MNGWIVICKVSQAVSAMHVFEIEGQHSISQNYKDFWVHNLLIGIDMKISKDSDEGKELSGMIENKKDAKFIMNHLDEVAAKHCDPKKLIEVIKAYGEKQFEKKDAKKKLMRSELL